MKSLKVFKSFSLLFITFATLFSCDPNRGMEKFEGKWIHPNEREKLPADTIRIEHLGNGNATIEIKVAKPYLLSKNGYKLEEKTLTGTYNPENERIDLPQGQPIIFNPNTNQLSLVNTEWTKVEEF